MSTAFSCLRLADDAGFFPGVWSRMFGQFIASAREKTGHSVEQAAVLAGLSTSQWSAIEAGTQLPKTRRELESMAGTLDMEWATMVQIVSLCREAWGLK